MIRHHGFGPLLVLGSLALVLVVLPRPGAAATGRDLTAGYRWFDSSSGALPGPGGFDMITTINPPDDSEPAGPVNLGFPGGFQFYGTVYNDIWISDNGWISFDDPAMDSHPTPETMPSSLPPRAVIAPFWADLICENFGAGQSIRYGRIASQGAFHVQWSAIHVATGSQAVFSLYLYTDGRIKFHYLTSMDATAATVGIENLDGDDGFAVVDRGAGAPGVPLAFPFGYVVDVSPPPLLIALCPDVPVISCGTTMGMLPDSLPGNILRYGCGTSGNAGREQAYAFDLATPSVVDLAVTAGTARNLRAYLLRACDETQCLRGPGLTHAGVLLGAGRYLVVVDTNAQADEGTFTLNLACTPLGPTMTCGDMVSGDTTGAPNRLGSYACAPTRALGGGEDWYFVRVPARTNLQAALSNFTTDLDVVVVAATAQEEITSADCVAWGDAIAPAWDLLPGDYLIGVDSPTGQAGSYDLTTTCGVAIDCTMTAGLVDLAAGPVQVVTGDTSGGMNAVELYRCDLSNLYEGPELVYEVRLDQPGQIAVRQTDGEPLSFFLLDGCSEGSCRGVTGAGIGCAGLFEAGIHYLVVDSQSATGSAFEAEVIYEQQFNRWTSCEDANGTTRVTDTESTNWMWSDRDYCIRNPGSRNPDGCIFAMYVTVWCGTEMHLPLYDVEGGHIRIYDVFRGEYVNMQALSTGTPPYETMGDEINWQGEDCNGDDPRWNNETTDIWISRDSGLCGIFRLEFIDHAGNVWELFANCDGDDAPQFPIHDNLCGALADYNPLPNVSLVGASPTYDCPNLSVQYELRNDGCAPAYDVDVVLLDGTTRVFVDTIPLVQAGELVVRTIDVTFSAPDTMGVQLVVDPDDTVIECTEVEANSCAVQQGLNEIVLPDCTTACRINAVATILPSRQCGGETVTIDASMSVSANCPGGLLDYQLVGPGGPSAWQAVPEFAFPAPDLGGPYTVNVRCADPMFVDTCVDSAEVTLEVDLRPILDPASITLADPCGDGIVVSWNPATWRGPAGTGFYNIYRSEASCTAGLVLLPAGRGIPDLFPPARMSFTDSTSVAGTRYFYVVEAEDGTGNSACQPTGPTVRGATVSAHAPGGTCAGITDSRSAADPATLPRIGARLRLGGTDGAGTKLYGPDFVELRWGTDIPLDPGEHFHVLRSDLPDRAFVQVNPDVPPLTASTWTDTAADQPPVGTHVLYYLVFTADSCEIDNSAIDIFRTPIP